MNQTEKDKILRWLSLFERELFTYQYKAYDDIVNMIKNLPVDPPKPHK